VTFGVAIEIQFTLKVGPLPKDGQGNYLVETEKGVGPGSLSIGNVNY
jgi:hypothetical protein